MLFPPRLTPLIVVCLLGVAAAAPCLLAQTDRPVVISGGGGVQAGTVHCLDVFSPRAGPVHVEVRLNGVLVLPVTVVENPETGLITVCFWVSGQCAGGEVTVTLVNGGGSTIFNTPVLTNDGT